MMTAEYSRPFELQRPQSRTLDLFGDPNFKLRSAATEIDNSVKTMTDLIKSGENVNPDYIDFHKSLAENTLNQARRQGNIDWVEYYRLAIASDYIEERALAPILFQEKNLYPERKILANGICGVAVDRLQEALEDYDRADTTEALNQLYGVCQELTILAMMNRPQSPSLLAVPSSRFEDRRRKTDLYLYHMIKDRSYAIKVQVKSSLYDEMSSHNTPTHGFLIVGADLDNTRRSSQHKNDKNNHGHSFSPRTKDLPVSRALVKLHNADLLSQRETKLLESSQSKLDNIVREQRFSIRGHRIN